MRITPSRRFPLRLWLGNMESLNGVVDRSWVRILFSWGRFVVVWIKEEKT
jgi:hypothetical protein